MKIRVSRPVLFNILFIALNLLIPSTNYGSSPFDIRIIENVIQSQKSGSSTQVWPGFEFSPTVVDTGSEIVAFNFEPTEANRERWSQATLDGGTRVLKIDEAYWDYPLAGFDLRLPIDGPKESGGQEVYFFNVPSFKEEDVPFSFVHKQFYRFQEEHFSELQVETPQRAPNSVEDPWFSDFLNPNIVQYVLLENRILQKYLETRNHDLIDRYFAVTTHRRSLMDPSLVSREDQSQRQEGTAEYVSTRAYGDEGFKYLTSEAEEFLHDTTHFILTQTLYRNYTVGGVLGFYLDTRENEEWKQRLQKGEVTYYGLLAEFFSAPTEDELNALLSHYPLDEMHAKAVTVIDQFKSRSSELITAYQNEEGIALALYLPFGHNCKTITDNGGNWNYLLDGRKMHRGVNGEATCAGKGIDLEVLYRDLPFYFFDVDISEKAMVVRFKVLRENLTFLSKDDTDFFDGKEHELTHLNWTDSHGGSLTLSNGKAQIQYIDNEMRIRFAAE